MTQNPVIPLSLLILLGGFFSGLDAYAAPTNAPFKKKNRVVAPTKSGLTYGSSYAQSAYTTSIYFNGDNKGVGLTPAVYSPWVPAPVAGQLPVRVVNGEGWVGRVEWFERHLDGHERAVSGVFSEDLSYVARIRWIKSQDGVGENLVANEIRMRGGDYKEGRYLDVSPKDHPSMVTQAAPISHLAFETNSQVVQNSGAHPISAAAAIPLAPSYIDRLPLVGSTTNNEVRSAQILLPDLNGEGDNDLALPTKKPQEDAWHKLHSLPSRSPLDLNNSVAGAGGDNLNKLFSAKDAPVQNNAPSVQLGNEATGANITPTSININFESSNSLGRIGVDYLSPGSAYGFGIKADGSHLLGKTVAGGANLRVNKNLREMGLNFAWMPKDLNLKTKLSASYMVGRQDFNFFSGMSTANLSQIGHYLSMQYIVPKKDSDYLHSIGLSTWGSSAKQTNNPDPIYGITDTPTYIEVTKDTRKLAVGTLRGSAADIQLGLTNQLIAKASAGYESIKFPYSDGSQDFNRRMYQDYTVQYSPIPEVALQAGYKMGAALNNIVLSATYGRWQIAGYKNQGINGIVGNQGLTVTYSIPLDGKEKSTPIGVLTRPELISDSKYILRDAIDRPVQLPQTFLAKVDPTAVKSLIRIDKQGFPESAKFNQNGDIEVSISVSAGATGTSIYQASKNGDPYDATGAFTHVSGETFTIRMRDLPVPAGDKDVYAFYVSEGANRPVTHVVKFSVLRK